MDTSVIAVVGRPNVGKSTLFNKLIGKRLAIVDDTPGVTRDRIFGSTDWNGRTLLLVDTGGIEPYGGDAMLEQMRRQAALAIDAAQVIVFLTDLRAGVTAADAEIASMLLRSGKPVVLCVNKCDKIGEIPPDFYEFYHLGLGDPVPVSAVHGHGTGDLLDAVLAHLPPAAQTQRTDGFISVAVIGKPNAGKSSLVNRIVGEERAIVSEMAGTTRDAIDSYVENTHGSYRLIDTAGLRRKSRVDNDIERYSVLRAKMAIARADVCIILLDGTQGFTEQDAKVAGLALEQGTGCIVAVNKWDIVEKDGKTMQQYRKRLEQDFSFMAFAPVVFLSAKTGKRVDELFGVINEVYRQNTMRISTGVLNDMLAEATLRVQPPTDKGRRLKIYYITQASTQPPTFVCFCNRADLFHFSYQRYIENQIRATFGLQGTPVRLIVRERARDDTK